MEQIFELDIETVWFNKIRDHQSVKSCGIRFVLFMRNNVPTILLVLSDLLLIKFFNLSSFGFVLANQEFITFCFTVIFVCL